MMPSMYDYNFKNENLTETRMIEMDWRIHPKIWKAVIGSKNKKFIRSFLSGGRNSQLFENNMFTYSTFSLLNGDISSEFIEVATQTNLVPFEFAGTISEEELNRCFVVPKKIFDVLQDRVGDEIVETSFRTLTWKGDFKEVPLDAFQQTVLQRAYDFFKEVDFSVDYEVRGAVFQSPQTLGRAMNDIIYLSNRCFSLGVRETVNTMIEEYIHLKFRVGDETRAFQTSSINLLIEYMCKKNAIIL